MRWFVVTALLCATACCTSKGGAPKVGKVEKGTKFECKGENKVVDDPAKCGLSK